MGMQLLEGTTNPDTYYGGPDPNNFNWLIESFTSTKISSYVDFQGQKLYIDIRGSFDTSQVATIPKTLDELSVFSTGQDRYTSFGLSVGTKAALTVNYDTPVTKAVFNRYTEAASNADYAASLAGTDVYTSVSGNEWRPTFLWGGNDTYIHRHLLQQNSDKVYGGDGTDKVVFDKVSTDFTIKAGNVWNQLTKKNDLTGFTVTDKNKVVNSMEVNEVERLQFTDKNIALDLAPTQSAGQTTLLIGAVLPGQLVYDVSKQALLGSVIGLFDQGFTLNQLSGALLRLPVWDVLTGKGAPTNTDIATYLVNNVYEGKQTTAITNAAIAAMNAETPTTQGTYLASLAASTANQTHVDLVGIQATGLVYLG